MLSNNILIYDLIKEKLLKIYSIFINVENDLLIHCKIEMKKWNEKKDNEFILFINGNILLFELNENNNEIQLKIINNSFFPNLADARNIKQLSKNTKQFYFTDKMDNSISIY